MTARVLLCADTASLSNPALIGLSGERLDARRWLACESDAARCRSLASSSPALEEIWVFSCDDMEPINLAAALKRDDRAKRVYLVFSGGSGSLSSRAASAHLDGVLSESLFVKRYAQVKRTLEESVSMPSSANAGRYSNVVQGLSERGAGGQDNEIVLASDSVSAASSRMPSGIRGTNGRASRGNPPRLRGKGASFIATIVSGSGGSGKSTVAALFALLCDQAGLRTAVLDADLQFGDMDYVLGVADSMRIDDALSEEGGIESFASKPGRKGPALISAPRRLEDSEEFASSLPFVLERLRSSFDVVVVNTGACWTDIQAVLLEASDAAVFVMDARPSSLRANVHAVELCARLGIATTGFTFVVNKHERTSLLSAVDVTCALHGARAYEVAYGGRDVDELLGAGCPGELIASRNPFVEGLRALLAELLPEEMRSAIFKGAVPTKRRRSLFSRGGRS